MNKFEKLVKGAETSYKDQQLLLKAQATGTAEKLRVVYDSCLLVGFNKKQAFELTKISLWEGILERTKNHNPSNPGD